MTILIGERVLDPARAPALRDHRPTWTCPVLPLAALADLAADWCLELAGRPLCALADLRPSGWIAFPSGPRRLRATLRPLDACAFALAVEGLDGVDPALSPWRQLATATLATEPRADDGWKPGPLRGAEPAADPYAAGELFHGRSLQVLREAWIGDDGADLVLAGGPEHVGSTLRLDLLDGVAQAVSAGALKRWGVVVEAGQVAFPVRLARLDVRGARPPSGLARAELRFQGFDAGDRRHPRVRARLLAGEAAFLELELVFRLLPLGPLAALSAAERRDFFRDRRAVPGAGLSRAAGPQTRLDPRDLIRCDWLPGTIAAVYGLAPGPVDPRAVVARDHVARRSGLHPSAVLLSPDGSAASTSAGEWRLLVRREGREWVAEDAD